MRKPADTGFTLNGYHMLAMFVAFFGVIVAVNLTMARFAVTHWTGLVVKNSYVASQQFNAKIAAHNEIAERGWREQIEARDGFLVWAIVDADGAPVAAESLTIHFNRPIGANDDVTITAERLADGTFIPVKFPSAGRWVATITAAIPGVAGFESVHRFELPAGA